MSNNGKYSVSPFEDTSWLYEEEGHINSSYRTHKVMWYNYSSFRQMVFVRYVWYVRTTVQAIWHAANYNCVSEFACTQCNIRDVNYTMYCVYELCLPSMYFVSCVMFNSSEHQVPSTVKDTVEILYFS